MSAASRKNDPFNFDDIYKQAGVEDLFVKKTLGELKQKKPSPGPVPASSPARAVPAAQAPTPAPNVGTFDLDFLSKIATPSGTPPSLSKPGSSANLESAGSQQPSQQQRQPSAISGRGPLDDPFSVFAEVPGAAPAQRHTRPAAPAGPPANGTGNLLDFDDGNAFFPATAPPATTSAVPRPATTAVAAPAAVPAGAPSPSRPGLMAAELTATAAAVPIRQPQMRPSPSASVPVAQAPQRQQQQQQPASPPPPPPDYDSHGDHRSAPAGTRPYPAPASPAPAAAAAGPPPVPHGPDGRTSGGSGGTAAWAEPLRATGSASYTGPAQDTFSVANHPHYQQEKYPQPHHQHLSAAAAAPAAPSSLAYGQLASEPSNSSSSSFSWGHTPASSGGISGVLKAFGKKAVRVAKAGLSQLEHALEGLDQQSEGQQGYPHQGGGGGGGGGVGSDGSLGTRRSGGGRSYDEGVPPSNDEALAWAVRLADLPPHAQQQELSHMPPALRRKVIEVLREQIRSEHEAAAMAQGQAHPHPHAASPGLASPGLSASAGYGHGAALSPRRDGPGGPGAAAPSPPGHGHGAPAPSSYSRGGSQDGGLGHPGTSGGTAGREQQQQQRQPPPPSYADVDLHAAAPPPPPAPVRQATHDLLGMGSVEVASSPSAPRPTAAVAAAAAAVSAPVVEDLLGFEDGPGTAPARPAAAQPSPRPAAPQTAPVSVAAARAPQPTSAPPSRPSQSTHQQQQPQRQQPPVVQMDDMDDFFSGGKPAAAATASSGTATPAAFTAAARAPSGSMHGSASAPNLGGRGAGGGSSSTAVLADMLHDDEPGGGKLGGDADVDVSGYEELYKGEAGQADEPELRRRLREQREAAKHAKMKAALAEKKAMEAEEAARREQQVALKDQYKTDIEAWKNRHKGNIRGLLGSLHTVLWPDSGWTPVSVGDLLEPAQIKKVYMRANLLVHPDKVRQRNGSAQQVAIADMVFDVLKEAWNAFR